MENENKNQEVQEEVKPDEKAPTLVQGAHEAARKLETENLRMEQNIKKLEELKAFETLGGQSEGRAQEVKPQEVSDDEYAQKALQGQVE